MITCVHSTVSMSLIQQPHFHAVLLAEIATQLDTQEREQYLKGGADSPDYLRAMQVVLPYSIGSNYLDLSLFQMS